MKKLALLIAVVSFFLLGASRPVDQTIRNLNIGTQNPTGTWSPPGQIKMNGNPINGLPNAVQSGQPCTYGNTSAGCNAAIGGGGSGTVGNGVAGDITYYPTTSTAVGGKTGVNHGFWAYETGAAPNSIAGMTAGQLPIWQPSGDPIWQTITGDLTLFPSGVAQVSTINSVIPGGTCGVNKWVFSLNGSAVPTCTQPAFTNISGLLNLATQTTGLLPVGQLSGVLSIANGGNGTSVPQLTQGAGINITGTWPNYTISAPNTGTISTIIGTAPITATTVGGSSTIALTTPLSVAFGGTGTATPGLMAGAGVTITGAWPNQTIAAPGTGVSNVTASAPLASSGGTTPNITITSPLPLANGGTQCVGLTHFAGLPGSPVKGQICSVDDATTCTAGTPVAAGGSAFCLATWDGAAWQPAGGATSAASGGVTAVNVTTPITGTGGTTPTIGLTTVPVAKGGTGATASGATAAHNIGAAVLGANGDITSLTGLTTPLSVLQGGTGVTTPGDIAGANITITGSFPNQTIAAATGFSVAGTGLVSSGGGTTIGLTSPVAVVNGGTGATTAGATAANNIGAAAKGANSDITSITGLSTPLAVNQGGTGTITPGLVAGTNITSITGTWPNQTINASGGSGGGPNTTQFCSSTNCQTSGTVTCTEPWQASSYKEVLCFLNACLNTTNVAQTCNYPTVFTQPPWPETNSNPTSTSTVSALSLPKNQVQPFTGYIIYKGL